MLKIDQHTQLNCVIGYPLAHTRSPWLHNRLYESLGLNAVLLACPHPKISALIEMIQTLSVPLVAVTMPFKELVLPYLDLPSDVVLELKAANTLLQRDGQLYGHNTDVDGLAYALRNLELTRAKVLILGAGGAARCAGYFLRQQAADLYWHNRTLEKAKILSSEFGGIAVNHEDLKTLPIDLIIHTTPLGMFPLIDEMPLKGYKFSDQQTVLDMVYSPFETQLLKTAKQQGARIISGVDMFIAQGLRQIELWTGRSLLTPDRVEVLKQEMMLTVHPRKS